MLWHSRATWQLAGLILLAAWRAKGAAAGAPDVPDKAFADWARQNRHPVSLISATDFADLEPLRQMIGNATLVSLGEGLHGSAEPLEFRNRLFRFLVEEMGFTAIALESGIAESFQVNDYVLGGPGDPSKLAAQGITSGLGGYSQQVELLSWMRSYNLDARNARKIQFYGMDISGFPGEPGAPLDIALGYLDRVDGTASAALRGRLEPLRPKLRIDRLTELPDHYGQLTQAQRDEATGVMADLVTRFETQEGAYIQETSEREYDVAYRATIAARQVDEYLRQIPVGWSPRDGVAATIGTVAVADRAKMDNIEWIQKQQGAGGKVLVFAHLGHVATTPVIVQLPGQEEISLPPLVGPYLDRRYGERLVTIGHFFGRDETPCSEQREAAAPATLEGAMAALDVPAFLLDLRSAPPAVSERLQPLHGLYGQRPTHALSVGEGIDVIFFTETATRASPCP